MYRFACILTPVFLGLAACTTFPQLDDSLSPTAKSADFPTLVPLEPLLAQANGTGADPQNTVDTLEARVSLLRAKAARLRGPVLDRSARARLAQSPN